MMIMFSAKKFIILDLLNFKKKILNIISKIENEGLDTVLPNLINRWFTDKFINNNQDIINNRFQQVQDTPLKTFLNVFRLYAITEMSSWLKEIIVPCLVMTGENDVGCNPNINKQIKQIENLVNEFSDFARMPKPLLKKNNLNQLINENINLINKLDKDVDIKLINHLSNEVKMYFDYEQFNRLFFNLIKNSLESIQEKALKANKINKNINIEIRRRRDYIIINLSDTGVGFKNKQTKDLIKPYFTTKKKGTGLGLSIVDKIVSDHNGSIKFSSNIDGAKVILTLPKN